MTHGLHSNNSCDTIPTFNVCTGMECKGSATPQSNGTAKQVTTAPEKLEPELRESILQSFSRLDTKTFAGFAYNRVYVNRHEYTDREVAQAVLDIQDQICDNPYVMMTVLGNEYDFLRRLVFGY